MQYEQSQEWKEYCALMQERPEEFRNTGSIDIVTDIGQVKKFVEETSKKIGVIYRSAYHILVVDLVKGADGRYFAYERLMSAVVRGAVVTIPKYNGRYILLKQYRHALRDYQYAFPRGFGESGLTSERNAGKELSEELGARVIENRFLGKIVADSGCSGSAADVYVCDITAPQIREGYEGIQDVCVLESSVLERWIADGKITDGFTLAAWTLLLTSLKYV